MTRYLQESFAFPNSRSCVWVALLTLFGLLLSQDLLGQIVARAEQPVSFGSAFGPTDKSSASRPDIVMIIADDQAWGDYGFMQHPHLRTPHLDQLARESQVFTRGYVPTSLCRPSLATIITGLYPHQHGIVGNDPPAPFERDKSLGAYYRNPEYQTAIEQFLKLHIDQQTTLPDRLSPTGYLSFQTGKWWEGNFSRGGFDDGMTHGDPNRGGRHGDVGLEIGRSTMQPIRDWIERSRAEQKPYFLWYAPFLPHTPHDPPQDLFDFYKTKTSQRGVARYWAMCERFDRSIGELRSIIAELGRPENTIIVYVCDNGWINQPDRAAYAPRSKRSPFEGGVRTPIMIHYPGRVAPRFDSVNLASSIDLVPTLMSLLDLPPDPALPGIDLTDEQAVSGRNRVFGEIFEHDIQDLDQCESSLMYRWVIAGNEKLIVPETSRIPDGSIELFDLQADPAEENDLSANRRLSVARLQKALDGWWIPKQDQRPDTGK